MSGYAQDSYAPPPIRYDEMAAYRDATPPSIQQLPPEAYLYAQDGYFPSYPPTPNMYTLGGGQPIAHGRQSATGVPPRMDPIQSGAAAALINPSAVQAAVSRVANVMRGGGLSPVSHAPPSGRVSGRVSQASTRGAGATSRVRPPSINTAVGGNAPMMRTNSAASTSPGYPPPMAQAVAAAVYMDAFRKQQRHRQVTSQVLAKLAGNRPFSQTSGGGGSNSNAGMPPQHPRSQPSQPRHDNRRTTQQQQQQRLSNQHTSTQTLQTQTQTQSSAVQQQRQQMPMPALLELLNKQQKRQYRKSPNMSATGLPSNSSSPMMHPPVAHSGRSGSGQRMAPRRGQTMGQTPVSVTQETVRVVNRKAPINPHRSRDFRRGPSQDIRGFKPEYSGVPQITQQQQQQQQQSLPKQSGSMMHPERRAMLEEEHRTSSAIAAPSRPRVPPIAPSKKISMGNDEIRQRTPPSHHKLSQRKPPVSGISPDRKSHITDASNPESHYGLRRVDHSRGVATTTQPLTNMDHNSPQKDNRTADNAQQKQYRDRSEYKDRETITTNRRPYYDESYADDRSTPAAAHTHRTEQNYRRSVTQQSSRQQSSHYRRDTQRDTQRDTRRRDDTRPDRSNYDNRGRYVSRSNYSPKQHSYHDDYASHSYDTTTQQRPNSSTSRRSNHKYEYTTDNTHQNYHNYDTQQPPQQASHRRSDQQQYRRSADRYRPKYNTYDKYEYDYKEREYNPPQYPSHKSTNIDTRGRGRGRSRDSRSTNTGRRVGSPLTSPARVSRASPLRSKYSPHSSAARRGYSYEEKETSPDRSRQSRRRQPNDSTPRKESSRYRREETVSDSGDESESYSDDDDDDVEEESSGTTTTESESESESDSQSDEESAESESHSNKEDDRRRTDVPRQRRSVGGRTGDSRDRRVSDRSTSKPTLKYTPKQQRTTGGKVSSPIGISPAYPRYRIATPHRTVYKPNMPTTPSVGSVSHSPPPTTAELRERIANRNAMPGTPESSDIDENDDAESRLQTPKIDTTADITICNSKPMTPDTDTSNSEHDCFQYSAATAKIELKQRRKKYLNKTKVTSLVGIPPEMLCDIMGYLLPFEIWKLCAIHRELDICNDSIIDGNEPIWLDLINRDFPRATIRIIPQLSEECINPTIDNPNNGIESLLNHNLTWLQLLHKNGNYRYAYGVLSQLRYSKYGRLFWSDDVVDGNESALPTMPSRQQMRKMTSHLMHIGLSKKLSEPNGVNCYFFIHGSIDTFKPKCNSTEHSSLAIWKENYHNCVWYSDAICETRHNSISDLPHLFQIISKVRIGLSMDHHDLQSLHQWRTMHWDAFWKYISMIDDTVTRKQALEDSSHLRRILDKDRYRTKVAIETALRRVRSLIMVIRKKKRDVTQ